MAAISAHFVARYGPPAPPKRHDQDLDWGGFLDLEITRLWNASTALLSTIPYVGDVGKCDPTQGGWYYDNIDAPTQLIACDFTCVQFKTGGSVSVVLGCPQQGLE